MAELFWNFELSIALFLWRQQKTQKFFKTFFEESNNMAIKIIFQGNDEL